MFFLCQSSFGQGEWNYEYTDDIRLFNTEDGIPSVNVRAHLTEDSLGFIWLSTPVGLYRFDGYNVKSYLANPEDSSSLHENYVCGFYTDKEGRQLIGSAFQGIAEYNPTEDSFQKWSPGQSDFAGNIRSMLQDRKGYYWSTSSYGLFKYHPETKEYTQYVIPDDAWKSKGHKPLHTSFYDLIEDPKENKLWLAAGVGFWTFDIDTEKFEWIYNENFQGQENDVQPRMVAMIWDQQRECFYLSSRSDGVFQYFPKENRWNQYLKNVKSNYPILADGLQDLGDRILVSEKTKQGSYIMSKETGNVHNLIFKMNGEKIYGGSYANLIDKNGYLFAIYEHGLARMNTAYLKREKLSIPNLAITNIKWGNETPSTQNPVYLKKLKLEKENKILKINYAAINPPSPKTTRYKYRLVGKDKDWVENGNQLEALYSNLKTGHYQFEVMAEDKVLGWQNQAEILNLHVFQPFWKNSIVRILGALLILSSLFFLMQKRMQEKRAIELKESQFEKQIAEVQMQALRSQMNPHFLFNTLNSIKHYVINKSTEEAADYLTKFSKLVRNILQNSNSSLVSLQSELDLMKLYMEIEAMRFSQGFKITMDIDEQLNSNSLKIPPMLLQPYVENAIWHGLRYKESGGELKIKAYEKKDGFICMIEDNGIGRKRAEEIKNQNLIRKKSLGTEITKNRIELINKLFGKAANEETIDLFDKEGNPSGTRVILSIPNFK